MYNVDDAIAKIDGYVISISGGGPFVGERRLVRINEVRRTAAYASLLTENGGGPSTTKVSGDGDRGADYTEPPVAHVSEAAVESVVAREQDREDRLPEQEGDGRQVESSTSSGKRRRGRRGGRRRSRAKAPNSEKSES